MIALLIVGILVLGGLAAWVFGSSKPAAARWISVAALVADMALVIYAWLKPAGAVFC